MFTNLSDALFLTIDENGLQIERQPISGVLMFGLGYGVEQATVVGCRNPNALRPFDPAILPMITFGETVTANGAVRLKYHNDRPSR